MKNTPGNDCYSYSTVTNRNATLKPESTITTDEPRSGRPKESTSVPQIGAAHCMVINDGR